VPGGIFGAHRLFLATWPILEHSRWEVGGGLPLFTELPRRVVFSETRIQLSESLCVRTGDKGRFELHWP
jgi:hypothetical protein